MTEEPRVSEQKPRRFKVPHTYVILFSVVILAVIGTYVFPQESTTE